MKFKVRKIRMEKPGRTRTILILLFITLAVGLIADIIFRLVNARVASVSPVQTVVAEPAGAPEEKEPLDTYRVIWERNLLQTTNEVIADAQMDVNSLQATRLQLELLGTVAGDGEYNYAIIEEKDQKKQRLFKVGDSVGNATLARVMRNAVVLRVGDRDEVLKMKKPEDRAPSRTERIPGRVPTTAEPREQGVAPPVEPGSQADVLNILTQARLSPHISMGSSGKPDGVAVSNIRPGSVLQNIGLVNGDIIREVNGKAISNPSDIVDAYKDLKPGATISVKIQRMGKQVTLNYNMD
ncbi:MAG: type II secretion system protein N [Syntrophales bacterium]